MEKPFSKSCYIIYWNWANQSAIDRYPYLKAQPFVGILPSRIGQKTLERIVGFEYYRGMNELIDMKDLISAKCRPTNINWYMGGGQLGHNPWIEISLGQDVTISKAPCGCYRLRWTPYKKSFHKEYIQHRCNKKRRITILKKET